MKIQVKDLHKNHPSILAAKMMVDVHRKHETLVPALEEVADEYPELDPEQIILLWIGVNAKSREATDA